MKQFAQSFYKSKQWQETRDYIISKYSGLCQVCQERPAVIVHHKIWLNADNINDYNITLNEDNLIPVCRECHALIHEGDSNSIKPTAKGIVFDIKGKLVKEDNIDSKDIYK